MAIEINNLSESLAKKIPWTDAWLRTDLWAYENGDTELASSEKTRLENL